MNINIRRLGMAARKYTLETPIVKQAFDTRRINQETDRNPRGNLQYYHRSEPFIDADLSTQLSKYMKVKNATDMLKDRYGKEPEWFDSYARVLGSALDRALRTEQKDGDFFKAQFNYLDELLYVRYRLSNDDIMKMGEVEIERAILSRDEKLLHKHIYGTNKQETVKVIGTQEPSTMVVKTVGPEDQLIDKLFGGVKANAENKDITRSITITMNDKINSLEKNG